jgi:hypothetical protein
MNFTLLKDDLLPTLKLLKKTIFDIHTVKDTKSDLDDMFFNYIFKSCGDDLEKRESATISYQRIRKLLACIETLQDPSGEVECKFTIK